LNTNTKYDSITFVHKKKTNNNLMSAVDTMSSKGATNSQKY